MWILVLWLEQSSGGAALTSQQIKMESFKACEQAMVNIKAAQKVEYFQYPWHSAMCINTATGELKAVTK